MKKLISKIFTKRSNQPKGFKINTTYWIFGIIGIIFFGMNLPSFNSTARIDETALLEKIEYREVKKIIFVKNVNEVITHAEVELINNDTKPPHLKVVITNDEYLLDQIEKKETDGYKVSIDTRTDRDWFGGIISWILPFLLILLIGSFILNFKARSISLLPLFIISFMFFIILSIHFLIEVNILEENSKQSDIIKFFISILLAVVSFICIIIHFYFSRLNSKTEKHTNNKTID